MTPSQWAHATALAGTVAFGAAALGAQNPAPPGFEAVSIKRHSGNGPSRSEPTPDGHVAINVPVFFLIAQAYPVRRSDEIVGAPDWFYDEPYDVMARFAGPPTAEQRQASWRRLLIERFKFQAHMETREQDTFNLVPARAGRVSPNLKPSTVDCTADAVGECTGGLTRGALTTLGSRMAELTRAIQPMTGRAVFDRTGLTGLYAFFLKFSSTRPGVALDPDARKELPDIFAALQGQLGLKLERARGPVDVLVIEHIEPPTEN